MTATAEMSVPAARPRPAASEISVTLKRQIWTEDPRGTYEIDVSLTAVPDPEFTVAANMDAVHLLLTGRLARYLDSATNDGGSA